MFEFVTGKVARTYLDKTFNCSVCCARCDGGLIMPGAVCVPLTPMPLGRSKSVLRSLLTFYADQLEWCSPRRLHSVSRSHVVG